MLMELMAAAVILGVTCSQCVMNIVLVMGQCEGSHKGDVHHVLITLNSANHMLLTFAAMAGTCRF